jgi:hypothetical protein
MSSRERTFSEGELALEGLFLLLGILDVTAFFVIAMKISAHWIWNII